MIAFELSSAISFLILTSAPYNERTATENK